MIKRTNHLLLLIVFCLLQCEVDCPFYLKTGRSVYHCLKELVTPPPPLFPCECNCFRTSDEYLLNVVKFILFFVNQLQVWGYLSLQSSRHKWCVSGVPSIDSILFSKRSQFGTLALKFTAWISVQQSFHQVLALPSQHRLCLILMLVLSIQLPLSCKLLTRG